MCLTYEDWVTKNYRIGYKVMEKTKVRGHYKGDIAGTISKVRVSGKWLNKKDFRSPRYPSDNPGFHFFKSMRACYRWGVQEADDVSPLGQVIVKVRLAEVTTTGVFIYNSTPYLGGVANKIKIVAEVGGSAGSYKRPIKFEDKKEPRQVITKGERK